MRERAQITASVRGTRLVLALIFSWLALMALPAVAHALTWTNAMPVGLIHAQPTLVTVDLFDTARLNAPTARITINGVALKTFVTNVGTARGHWVMTETYDPELGVWKVNWQWVPDPPGTTKATIYCYPTALGEGTKNVSVTVKNVNGVTLTYSWSFSIGVPPKIGSPTPASGSTLTTLRPTITVPVSDNVGVTSWNASFDGVPAGASLLGGVLSITPVSPLANDAVATLSLTVFDAVGAWASRSWSYYVQAYPPMAGDFSDCLGCHQGYDTGHNNDPDCASCHAPGAWSGLYHSGEPSALHTRASLDPFCADCHVSDLLSEHGRYADLTCVTCHADTRTNVIAAIAAGDSNCYSCHGVVDHYESVDHTATPAPQNIGIAGVDFGSFECAQCHSLRLGELHQAADGSPDCAACHPAPRDTLAPWQRGCVQGGCHAAGSATEMHASVDFAHVYPSDKGACLEAGCHDATAISPFVGMSLADLHSGATTTVAGDVRTSCEVCHDAGVTPTANCLSSGCHPERALPHGFDPVLHTAAPTVPESGVWPYVDTLPHWGDLYFNEPYAYTLACGDCHDLQLAAEHRKPTASSATYGCANCHPTPGDALVGVWDKSCSQGGCHAAAGTYKHESLPTAHASAPSHVEEGCGFVASSGRQPCHYSDIVQEHNRTITTASDGFDITTKTLSVPCIECHGSAAFASLNGAWDGTCADCHDGTALRNHAVVGSARYSEVYAKHGTPGSNTMDAHGWIRVNPDGDGAYAVGGCGTHTCHSNAWRVGGWPDPEENKYCYQCHAYDPLDHTGTPTAQTYAVSGTSFGPYPCTDCHDAELGPEHAKPGTFSDADLTLCQKCHPAPRNGYIAWDRTTCVQGGCHAVGSGTQMHAAIDTAHVYPSGQSSCLEAGCHALGATLPFVGRSLADLHSAATTTVAGDTRTACRVCHYDGATLTNNCTSSGCHPERALPHGYDAATHTGSPTAQDFTIGSATYAAIPCSSCHELELAPEHAKTTSTSASAACGACHPSPRGTFLSWDRSTCVQSGCHAPASSAPMHGSIDSSHARLVANDGCFPAGCHADGTLAAVHSEATTSVAGTPRISCMVCHADGIPATKDCATCHSEKVASHYDPVLHTATFPTIDFIISSVNFGTRACTNCHPSPDLATNHAPLCSTCHPVAVDATAPWSGLCGAAGCHAAGTTRPMHAEIDTAHAFPANKQSCLAAGCHDAAAPVPFAGRSLADLHSNATTTVAGDTRTSCGICHVVGVAPVTECLTCHDFEAIHANVSVPHPATVLQAPVVYFGSNAEHTVNEMGAPLDVFVTVTCSLCHGVMDLLPLHNGNCALCHSGPNPPRDSFTAWAGGCSQGTCHQSYHTLSSSGHDSAYINDLISGSCDSCHPKMPDPPVGTAEWCGSCHILSP